MADETKSADKPLATLDEKEKALDVIPPDALYAAGFRGDEPDPAPAIPDAADRDEFPATDRIRAFEDEHLGVNAVRIHDKIERGSGSPFAALSDEHKRQYAALENLGVAEQKLADAHAALIQADIEHDAALAAAEPKPDAE